MAHRKPLYSECSIYMDVHHARAPQVGDVIQTTADDPSHYRIAGVKRVTERSAHYPYRHNLSVVRIPPEDVNRAEDCVIYLTWYARERAHKA